MSRMRSISSLEEAEDGDFVMKENFQDGVRSVHPENRVVQREGPVGVDQLSDQSEFGIWWTYTEEILKHQLVETNARFKEKSI